MEGRRSRSKPAEAEPATPPMPAKSPARAKVAATDAGKALVDDRYVPTVGGENKRKRAPRGPAGRNLKAKVEEETKSAPAAEEEVSGSRGVTDSEEKRRGSSRLRIRPSKFRESAPASSSKVKDENSKEDDQAVQLVPSQVDTRELIARIFSRRKENMVKGKDKAAAASSTVPDRAGLKAVLVALKRVMKMKEAEPFNKPVDPVKLGIPDYFEVVKKPMDLGTIRDRLEKGEVYTTVDGVFEDVALVWSNCRQYNDGGDPIVGLLANLESTFNKLCLAAGFPFHTAEANSEEPKGEDIIPQQTDDQVKVPKKKKAKVAQPGVGTTLLKPKIKRSAPVDQVMAESKAREQKDSAEELNVGDVERDVKNAVESSSGADKQEIETPQPEQRSEDEEVPDDDDPESVQELVETPPVKEEESAPTRLHRKSANSQHVIAPAKVKRPNGHSTLTHRQGCLCVVCVGRRKREAKLRKSGAHSKSNRSAKKKLGGPNSDDMAAEAEDLAFAEDGEDALNGFSPPDNLQGYPLSNYQLPLRKLDPSVLEMSRLLLGSKPGSIWNRPRSLGYVAVPLPGRGIGIADAISFLSH